MKWHKEYEKKNAKGIVHRSRSQLNFRQYFFSSFFSCFVLFVWSLLQWTWTVICIEPTIISSLHEMENENNFLLLFTLFIQHSYYDSNLFTIFESFFLLVLILFQVQEYTTHNHRIFCGRIYVELLSKVIFHCDSSVCVEFAGCIR